MMDELDMMMMLVMIQLVAMTVMLHLILAIPTLRTLAMKHEWQMPLAATLEKQR